jgi:hypothetical protein
MDSANGYEPLLVSVQVRQGALRGFKFPLDALRKENKMIKVPVSVKVTCDHKNCEKWFDYYGVVKYGMSYKELLDDICSDTGYHGWRIIDGEVLCPFHAEDVSLEAFIKKHGREIR